MVVEEFRVSIVMAVAKDTGLMGSAITVKDLEKLLARNVMVPGSLKIK